MKTRIRFSLGGLLVLATALILLLGYGQQRRREILRMCAELREDGYIFDVPSSWHDYFWQRKPTIGTVFYQGVIERVSKIERRTSAGVDSYMESGDYDEVQRLKRLGVVEYAPE